MPKTLFSTLLSLDFSPPPPFTFQVCFILGQGEFLFSNRVCPARMLNRCYYIHPDTQRPCGRSVWCLAHSVSCHHYSYASLLCGFNCHADSARQIPRRIAGTHSAAEKERKWEQTHQYFIFFLFLSSRDGVFGGYFPWKRHGKTMEETLIFSECACRPRRIPRCPAAM